ncbi:MAG: hypothetical protein ABJN62_02225 [Halioglobus sp.]
MKIPFAIVLILMLTSAAQAALTVDGYREMQEKYGKDNEAIDLQVRMYLDGLLDGLFMGTSDVPEDKRSWCIPDDQQMTDELALKLFEKELKLRGGEYKEFSELGIQVPFSLVMVDALQRAFPCKGK